MFTIEFLKKLRTSQIMNGFAGVDGFTPVDLVNQQLDKIRLDYSNPLLKFFFPAAGHGTYAIVVYWKLMSGLSELFIDNEERSRHILENMLYLNEINAWLCEQLQKQGFLNVNKGSFLNYETNMKFDVIIGNPPYQENDDKGKSKGGGRNVIRGYGSFVKHGLELLKQEGSLLYIIPQGWQVNTNALWNLLTNEFSLDYIDNNNDYYQKFFDGVGSTFCVIKASNKKYNGTTFVESFGNLNLKDVPTLPNTNDTELLRNIINFFSKKGKKLKFKGDSNFHYQKKSTKENVRTLNDNVFVYPIKHTSSKTFYSRIPHPAQNIPKVIVSDSGYLSPFFDNGQFGVTQHSPYMIVNCEEEGNKIVDFLNSDEIQLLLQVTKKSGFFNINVINSLSYE